MATPTRKAKSCAKPVDPVPSVQLPMVKSYALDIPTDPAELAQFDRSVSSIFYRITGRVTTKTTNRKRGAASGDSHSGTERTGAQGNVDPADVAALEENDKEQQEESQGYLSENSPGKSEVNELNDDDCDQQAFWAWVNNCDCPKGTKRSQCSCERMPAYFAWVDNCTCNTNVMGKCTCGACEPQFLIAKRLKSLKK